jgi:hypothetical protein
MPVQGLQSLIRPRQMQHMADVKCPQFRRLKWGWGDLWPSWPMQRSGHEAKVGGKPNSQLQFSFAEPSLVRTSISQHLWPIVTNHMTWKAIASYRRPPNWLASGDQKGKIPRKLRSSELPEQTLDVRSQYQVPLYYLTVTAFKYVEDGPDREAPEVV